MFGAAMLASGLMLAFRPDAAAAATVSLPVLQPDAAAAPDVSAYAAAVVIDTASGATLLNHHAARSWPAASLTKLMTARVFVSTPTNWSGRGAIVKADEVGGGRLQVVSGTVMTLRDILHSAIAGSANNAAQALARLFDGRGASAFVERMNQTAARIGLAQTAYHDASGMNPKNTTSAYDTAVMLLEAARDEETRSAMTETAYRFTTKRPVIQKNIKNTNDLLFTEPDIIVTAGKTGYLTESKHNYAVRLHPKDDPARELVISVFGAPSRADAVASAVKLARWAWAAHAWTPKEASAAFTRNMVPGERGADIRELQRFLNQNGYAVAASGAGSPGRETDFYGGLTQAALKHFQNAHPNILAASGAKAGSGALDFATRAAIHGAPDAPRAATAVTTARGAAAANADAAGEP